MDWLKNMNSVIKYIEENLTESIPYESLSRIVGCSVYEFSRIFSFMAEMSISEYIRRRRLSQAVFDLQSKKESIIDIAYKYSYESPSAFTRAFKGLHGVAPSSARKIGINLKCYPPISFVLTIKGVNAMEFRIEQKKEFQIMGLSWYYAGEAEDGVISPWDKFMEEYNPKLWNNGDSYYSSPYWQVGAYEFKSADGKTPVTIGAEYKGKMLEGMILKNIPAATWAVFPIHGATGSVSYDAAFTRILTEWLPASQYKRDEDVPNLDSYPPGHIDENYVWEIWLPVLNK